LEGGKSEKFIGGVRSGKLRIDQKGCGFESARGFLIIFTFLKVLFLIFTVFSSTTTPTELKTTLTLQINNCLNCDNWSPWEECTQICGGCGKIKRKRSCNKTSINCQTEEKRICNQNACPAGTNFLFSNGEFQLNFLFLK